MDHMINFNVSMMDILAFFNENSKYGQTIISIYSGETTWKGRGNMCLYAIDVPDCKNQSLQHFVSDSPWDHQPVIDHIQRDVIDAVEDENNGSLHVDECCFLKQGKDSVEFLLSCLYLRSSD